MASRETYDRNKWNTLRPRQNGRRFADNVFKYIFLNENVWIWIKISLKFVLKGPINNIPALVQIMAWHRPGDKPLSDPKMVNLLTHICVTLPQWVNQFLPTEYIVDITDDDFKIYLQLVICRYLILSDEVQKRLINPLLISILLMYLKYPSLALNPSIQTQLEYWRPGSVELNEIDNIDH